MLDPLGPPWVGTQLGYSTASSLVLSRYCNRGGASLGLLSACQDPVLSGCSSPLRFIPRRAPLPSCPAPSMPAEGNWPLALSCGTGTRWPQGRK